MIIGDGAHPKEVTPQTDADNGATHARTVSSGGPVAADKLRDLAGTEVATLVARVLNRRRDNWRTAVDAATSALREFERACNHLSAWDPAEAASEVSALVDVLLAAARAESAAAIDRARAEARGRIDELEQHLGRIEAESADLRHRLGRAIVAQQEELALRVRAEALGAKSQRVQEQMVARYELQLQAARLQAESEHLQFESLRQQLMVSLTRALRDIQAEAPSAVPDHAALPPPGAPAAATLDTSGPGHDVAPPPGSPIERNGLRLVTMASALPPAPPEALEHLTRLLEEAEAKYQADVAARVPPLETVDRLTQTLRAARDHFSAVAIDSVDGGALFKAQLIALVNARADSAFGRHLGISLYALYPPGDDVSESVRIAS